MNLIAVAMLTVEIGRKEEKKKIPQMKWLLIL